MSACCGIRGGRTDSRRSRCGVRAIRVRGWAADQDTTKAILVNIGIDGKRTQVLANLYRPDVARVYPSLGPNHGFSTSISIAAGTHKVCVGADNAAGGGGHVTFRCSSIRVW